MSKKKVLLVDDNPMDRIIIRKILEELNIEPIETAQAGEFLTALKDIEPDLCLVDLNISQNNDGSVLVKAIRNKLGPDLPIIIISANEDTEAITENLKNGANDFICKPVDKVLLTSKISNFLTSDSIKDKILPTFKFPKTEGAKCSLLFPAKIELISEEGGQIQTPYFIDKDTTIELAPEFFNEFFQQDFEHVMFTITESWKNEETQTFHSSGLFTDFTPEIKSQLRLHLAKKLD